MPRPASTILMAVVTFSASKCHGIAAARAPSASAATMLRMILSWLSSANLTSPPRAIGSSEQHRTTKSSFEKPVKFEIWAVGSEHGNREIDRSGMDLIRQISRRAIYDLDRHLRVHLVKFSDCPGQKLNGYGWYASDNEPMALRSFASDLTKR